MRYQLVSVTCFHFRSEYQLPAVGPNLAWVKSAIGGTALKSGARLYRGMCYNMLRRSLPRQR